MQKYWVDGLEVSRKTAEQVDKRNQMCLILAKKTGCDAYLFYRKNVKVSDSSAVEARPVSGLSGELKILSPEEYRAGWKKSFEELNPGQDYEKQPVMRKMLYLHTHMNNFATVSSRIRDLESILSCASPEVEEAWKMFSDLQELKAIPMEWKKHWDDYVIGKWTDEDMKWAENSRAYLYATRGIEHDCSLLRAGDHAVFGKSERYPELYTGEVVSVGRKNVKLKTQSKMYGEQVITLPISEYRAHYPKSNIEFSAADRKEFMSFMSGTTPEKYEEAQVSYMRDRVFQTCIPSRPDAFQSSGIISPKQRQQIDLLTQQGFIPEIPEEKLNTLTFDQAAKMISAGKKNSLDSMDAAAPSTAQKKTNKGVKMHV